MLNVEQAKRIAEESIPSSWKITKVVNYREVYLFSIEHNTPHEEGLDQLFSVNKLSGEFRDFSILTDGDISEIVQLFANSSRQ